MDRFLVFRRTGRTIAMVLAFGFGGGTLALGIATSVAGALHANNWLMAIWPAFKGYSLAALPFFLGGAVLAVCWRELWVVRSDEGESSLRMITFRPWMLRGPRVEQASMGEYSAVCTSQLTHRAEKASYAVALMTSAGEQIPVREFNALDEARTFVESLADISGLPIRRDESLPPDGTAEDAAA